MESNISTTLLEKHGNVRGEDQSIVRIDGERVCPPGCGFSDEKRRAEDALSRSTAARKLGLATLFCLIFVAVEVVGGLLSNSLAILTDAAHLLSDVAGFAISLFAIWASSWEATPRQSYGFFRLEILGALLSIQLIWLLTGIIVYEAIYRLIHTGEAVDGRLMFLVASFGLVVNIVMVFLLGHGHGHDHDHDHGHGHGHGHGNSLDSSGHKNTHGHGDQHQAIDQHHGGPSHGQKDTHDSHDGNHGNGIEEPQVLTRKDSYRVDIDIDGAKKASKAAKDNINVRGAWLHVLGDLIQSVGVMIGGAVIWVKPEWQIVDLICTLLFSALVLFTTVRMLRDILEILMESTPREIDVKSLEKGLIEIEGVIAIHELHIWAITMGKTLLACHVTIHPDANADVILHKVISYCEQAFNISHVTVQIERKRGNLITNGDLLTS